MLHSQQSGKLFQTLLQANNPTRTFRQINSEDHFLIHHKLPQAICMYKVNLVNRILTQATSMMTSRHCWKVNGNPNKAFEMTATDFRFSRTWNKPDTHNAEGKHDFVLPNMHTSPVMDFLPEFEFDTHQLK